MYTFLRISDSNNTFSGDSPKNSKFLEAIVRIHNNNLSPYILNNEEVLFPREAGNVLFCPFLSND